MTELVQQLIDGLGRGVEYALLGLGIALMFGVLRMVNFAYGELITVSGYVTYWLATLSLPWPALVPAIVVTSILTSVAIEALAFRRLRKETDFARLLASFGVHFVVQALFVMLVSPNSKPFDRPDWIANTVSLAGVNVEVLDLAIITTAAAGLALTVWILTKTVYGVAIRAAAEDFDTARLLGVNAHRVIQAAFALAGLLGGLAAVFFLMRTGRAAPSAGLDPMLKGVLAALVGGLGRLHGAVLGGIVIGIAEVQLVSRLPESVDGMVNGILFLLIAVLFIFRPAGLLLGTPTGERV